MSTEHFTDPIHMQPVLQSMLPGYDDGILRITALRVRKTRRSASRARNPNPINVCFEIEVADRASGRAGWQMIYAKVYRKGRAEQAYARFAAGDLTRPRFGEPLSLVRDLDMIVWASPNDPGLPQLQALLVAERLEPMLPWAAMDLDRSDCEVARIDLLRYEPEQRATLRVTLRHRHEGGERALYAKTFCGDLAGLVDERFRYFWAFAGDSFDAPRVAEPLGYTPSLRTFWQAEAAGTPLLAMLTDSNAHLLMRRVAFALARLHDAPLQPAAQAESRSQAHWLTECRRRLVKISRADAALHVRVARVVDAIERHAAALPARATSLVHGDFHPGQLWVHEGRVVLFDFDEFAWGDPMEDLASFVHKLESAGVSPAVGTCLVTEYARCAPARFDRSALAWHLTIQSLLQVSRAFIFQQPGWMSELRRRLVHAEGRAARLLGGSDS